MDPVYTSMFVCAILLMISGMVLGRIIGHLIWFWNHFKTRNQFPKLEEVFEWDEVKCTRHSWIKTTLALAGLDPGPYLACELCGQVSGTNFKLNSAAIQVLRNNKHLKEQEGKAIDRMKQILEADFNMWVKTWGHEFGKDSVKNIQLLEKFSKFTVESFEAAGRQVEREFKGKL